LPRFGRRNSGILPQIDVSVDRRLLVRTAEVGGTRRRALIVLLGSTCIALAFSRDTPHIDV
jgi:hypothetical protein